MTQTTKPYYRVVDPEFEKPGIYSTYIHLSAERQRYDVVLPLLNLDVRLSYSTGMMLATAIQLGVWCDKVLEVGYKHLQAGDHHVPLRELCVKDTHLNEVPLDTICAYVNEYIDKVTEENQLNLLDYQFIWQYIWEIARLEYDKSLPPRQRCLMLWKTLAEAEAFLTKERNPVCYSIVQVNLPEGALTHEYDMTWLDDVPTNSTFAEAIEYARKYWRGEKTPNPVMEVLYAGDYTITEL